METALPFFLVGLFTIVCAAMDWSWFMSNYRARLFVRLFGRNGARIFYIVLGLICILPGGVAATNQS